MSCAPTNSPASACNEDTGEPWTSTGLRCFSEPSPSPCDWTFFDVTRLLEQWQSSSSRTNRNKALAGTNRSSRVSRSSRRGKTTGDAEVPPTIELFAGTDCI